MTRAVIVLARGTVGLLAFFLLGLQACSSVPGTSSDGVPESPLFPSDFPEIGRYEETIRDQDGAWPACEEAGLCPNAHFTKALVALYRNQAEAVSHFRKVVEQAPDTHKADASKAWLRLLSANAYVERPRLFPRAAEHLVRQYLVAELRDRERIQALRRERDALEQELAARTRDLAARTRDVEKLTQQLEALKRIDREIDAMRDKARPSSPPTGQETSEPSQDP